MIAQVRCTSKNESLASPGVKQVDYTFEFLDDGPYPGSFVLRPQDQSSKFEVGGEYELILQPKTPS